MPGNYQSMGMPKFSVSNLSITPNSVKVGEAVNISIYVTNNGMQTGKYSVVLRIGGVVENISDIEYIVTDSEIEALVLESTLIKKHKPRYNIRLKDDKKYPYITVTLSEAYPRVLLTRRLSVPWQIWAEEGQGEAVCLL